MQKQIVNVEIELLPHQKKLFESDTYITGMSCAVGAGKSWTVALKIIVDLLQGKRVLIITDTYAQLRDVLINQILGILDEYKIPYNHNKNRQIVNLGKGMMFAKTNKNAETIRGLTKIDTVCIDEAQNIEEKCFNYAMARQRGIPNAKMYLTGTGCSKQHWFAKKCMDPKNTWITADIFSNEKHNKRDYIDRMLDGYKDMPQEFIQRELYGLFTDGSDKSLFDIIKTDALPVFGSIVAGLDIAGTGEDFSCIAVFNGNVLVALRKKKTMDKDILEAWKKEITAEFGVQYWRHDCTGIGNLFRWPDSQGINFGGGGNGRFLNQRARIYFDLRHKLQQGIAFGNDSIRKFFENAVMAELMATELDKRESPKIKLVEKGKIRKSIGKSPDLADALALASWIPSNDILQNANINQAINSYNEQAFYYDN